MNQNQTSGNVVVIGAGKMGLPLACELACNGASVCAVDVNIELVEKINAAEAPFEEPQLQDKLSQAVASGKLRATTKLEEILPKANVIIIIVPVLLDKTKNAELSIIESVSREIAQGVQPGALIVFETTLPVGTSRKLLAEIADSSGLVMGESIHGAFSPERVKSRHVFENLAKVPKIVGGFSPQDADKAEEFYKEFLKSKVINLGSLEAAEMAKLADMVYRDVNIALANELSRYCEAAGVDFFPVREAANTSGEAHLLIPGIGVGGHCTPIYPYFLINHAQQLLMPQELAETSRRVNDSQAAHAVGRLKNHYGTLEGKRVLIMGLAFRPEIKEATASSAFLIAQALDQEKAIVLLHDPYFAPDEMSTYGFQPAHSVEASQCSILILNTAHAAYQSIDWSNLARQGVEVVMDGRNAIEEQTVQAAGIKYIGIGRKNSQ
ncbi:MAG: nucleotide sugar dehydrogenase [Sumerlaeia bacterium]